MTLITETKIKIDWTTKSILVVEDEYINYYFIAEVLKDTNVHLLWAKDGLSAVEMCQNENQIDLILMDLQLPKLDGYSATQRIKAIMPKVPIIAQTAYATKTQQDKCFQVGCIDYIAKPYLAGALLNIIEKHI